MKKFIVAVVFLAGCTATRFEYPTNKPLVAATGSTMLKWSESTYAVISTSNGRHELIYAGMNGNAVHLRYRVTTMQPHDNAVAKPDLDQDITSDISESKIITFQELRLQVDDADSDKITFEVLHGPFADS